ncbi:hypothetical protein [uncultured Polaribacter sp.]|uniref:hypothetical protein n=1 Tax=uncultured Polaribacter sp. TaxID=174711 RepID=UPI0026124F77|nr:hypothetical protein [uncultured Polaribacter sp.]
MSGHKFEKAAIFLSFKIDSFPNRFSAQFDTGAESFFKENTISSFIENNTKLLKKLDSISGNKNLNNLQVKSGLSNLNLKFKDTVVLQKKVFLYPNTGKIYTEEEFDTSRIHLGTLGVDLLKNKILIMDYVSERLTILEEIPSNYKIKKSIPFVLDDINRVYLPIKLRGNSFYIMFDTGSSVFSLITFDKTIWNGVKKNSNMDTLSVSSFGKYYDVYGSTIEEDVYLMDMNLKNFKMHYNTRPVNKTFLNGLQVIGTTGNKLFLNKMIAVNYKNNTLNILE